jgi:hypothetical protein
MAVKFYLRGDSKNARYTGDRNTPSEFGTNSVDSGDIGNVINLDQASFGEHALVYPAYSSLPTGQQFSVHARVATGSTGDSNQIFYFGLPASRYSFQARFSGAGTIVSTLFDANGNTNTTQTYTFAYTTGVYYDLVWLIDTSVTTAGLILYKDGVSVATTNLNATRAALPSQRGAFIILGSQNAAAQGSTRLKVAEFTLDDTIITPTSVALISGTGSLNGASRTSYRDIAAFEGGNYTDPAIANVKTGTGYTFAGSSLTGTYDGSDRWTDPGESNVLTGITYKANSTTVNKTGTLSVTVDADDVAAAVWDRATASHTTAGTFGALIQKLLTVGKFLGLK